MSNKMTEMGLTSLKRTADFNLTMIGTVDPDFSTQEEVEEKVGIAMAGVKDNTVIDNHTGKPITIAGFAVLESGYVCCLLNGTIFCLNSIYTELGGRTHLSTASIGGNIDARARSLPIAIEAYNDEIQRLRDSGMLITNMKVVGYVLI